MWRLSAVFFFFKQKTAYEITRWTGVQTCALPISHALRVHALQPRACGERGERCIALGRVHQENDEAALEHLARETAGQLTSGRSPAVVARGSRLGYRPAERVALGGGQLNRRCVGRAGRCQRRPAWARGRMGAREPEEG